MLRAGYYCGHFSVKLCTTGIQHLYFCDRRVDRKRPCAQFKVAYLLKVVRSTIDVQNACSLLLKLHVYKCKGEFKVIPAECIF